MTLDFPTMAVATVSQSTIVGNNQWKPSHETLSDVMLAVATSWLDILLLLLPVLDLHTTYKGVPVDGLISLVEDDPTFPHFFNGATQANYSKALDIYNAEMAGYPTQLGNVPNRPIPDSSDNEVLNIGPVAFGGLVDGFVMEGSLSQRSVAYTKESQEAMVKETDTIEQFDFNNTTKHFKEFHKILEGESHTIRQESLQRLYGRHNIRGNKVYSPGQSTFCNSRFSIWSWDA